VKYLRFVGVMGVFSFIVNLYAGSIDIKDLSPVVIRTFPVGGARMVDPSIRKLYVTFSDKMVDKSWSLVKSDLGVFPKLNGSLSYDPTQRTCIINVLLKPNTTYVFWINSGKFAGFKGVNGKSAVPYMLSFRTGGEDFADKKDAALKASESWLALLGKGKYSESWRSAALYFQKQVRSSAWSQQIDVMYSNLGKVKSRKFISASYTRTLPKAPKGEYFIIRFETSFEGKDKVIETIIPMLTKEGKWKVAGYFIK